MTALRTDVDRKAISNGRARWWWAVAATIAVIAFAARLRPVLNGGGFTGLGNYDDGVYFGAALALVHGYLPYRDFVLLHPPGVVLALAPFALLSRVTTDPLGLAAARLAWMLLGALNAVLVARILRPVGRYAAVLGGLCYAGFYPAIYVELTTQLQGLANTCLLGGLALLARGRTGIAPTRRSVVLAGSLLAAAACVKIWGAAAVLIVLVWVLRTGGARRALALLTGVAVGGVAICLPFFLAAPSAMWREVVTAQLGRPRATVPLTGRLDDIVGLRLYANDGPSAMLLWVGLAALVLAAVPAWREERTRIAVLLLVGLGALLLASPSWYQHYAGLTAPMVALIVGAAAQWAVDRLGGRLWGARVAVGAVLAGALVLVAAPVASAAFSHRFPRAQMSAAAADLPGCVTSDFPTALIQMNTLSRNLERGCPVVLDLGGYSFVMDEESGQRWPRVEDRVWQRQALDYLGSGTASMVVDNSAGPRFSKASLTEVRSWPELRKSGTYRLRSPDRTGG